MQKHIAVVGCGYWGANLIRNFAQMGVLGAVCDDRPDVASRTAQQFEVQALSLDQVIADRTIAGVAIATPAETHATITINALRAGKHVFVEKPIALTVADGERMRDAAKAAEKTLMVGHLLQYHPAFQTLLAMTKAGELGALRYAYSNRLSLGKFRVEENTLWSFAPHDVSMLLALFGTTPDRVTYSGGSYLTPRIDDTSRLDMHFAGGQCAHVFASWLHPFKEHRLVVVGEKAMVVFEDSAANPQDKLRLYRHAIDRSGPAPTPVKATGEAIALPEIEPLRNECMHFVECVDGKRARPITDADEGLAVLNVLSAASSLAT
jgi:UDP-2-acetamido-3-amino-2,3-dideoxy-glucuronate N-acetyltransferase